MSIGLSREYFFECLLHDSRIIDNEDLPHMPGLSGQDMKSLHIMGDL
ncbi:MAG: hypothetical protein ABSD38_21530 [Syntrophorhabdales bacterium]